MARQKPLSLADRIAREAEKNKDPKAREREKELIESFTKKENRPEDYKKNKGDDADKNPQPTVRSGQGQVDPGSTQYQPWVDPGSSQGQVKVTPRSGQGQVSDIRSRSGQGQVNTNETDQTPGQISSIRSGSGQGQVNSIQLAEKQEIIYNWFIRNGFTGYFNKGRIQAETGVNHPTIRKCIKKLQDLDIIKVGEFNPVSRTIYYEINTEINVQQGSSIRSRSGQGQVIPNEIDHSHGQVSSIRSGSGQGQVKYQDTSYRKKERLNNISFFLEHSEFWKETQLSIQKIEKEWIEKYELDSAFIFKNLQMGEQHPDINKAADKPAYLLRAMLNGGLTRPKNFEFPDERKARIEAEEAERREKALKQLEEAHRKNQELADQEAFFEFLSDHEAVEQTIREKIETQKGGVTPKLKTAISVFRKSKKIDSRLESRLKIIFQSDD